MSSDHRSLPAIHDWHLERVLSELKLDERIRTGDARCAFCRIVVPLERIGAILVVRPGEYAVVCDRSECLSRQALTGAS